MDKRYYYFNGTEQIGPLSFNDLQNRNLTPDTLFWYEGLPEWKKGHELPDLSSLFNRMPPPGAPPVNPSYNQPPYNQPQYNQPPYNQPQYNQPPHNQPQYNQPPYANPNPQYPPQYSHSQLQPTPPVYEWYLMAWQKYAQFTGRARRSEYWYFVLFNFLAAFVAGFIDGLAGSYHNGNGLISGLYTLAALLPSLAVAVRRMHDVGKSGWFLLIPIYNLILACTEGDRGPNEYGPDPKYV